jgi:hypothetical protein
MLVGLHGPGHIQKAQRASKICRGTLVQKYARIAGQAVALGFLGEKSVDHEKIAQDADAAYRSLAPGCKVFGDMVAFADGREQLKLDSGSQGFGLLKSVGGLKK